MQYPAHRFCIAPMSADGEHLANSFIRHWQRASFSADVAREYKIAWFPRVVVVLPHLSDQQRRQ